MVKIDGADTPIYVLVKSAGSERPVRRHVPGGLLRGRHKRRSDPARFSAGRDGLMSVGIIGAACRIDRQFSDGVEPVIRTVVRSALEAAGLSIADIEMAVTVASDALDGIMVPVRSELAGTFGKSYLNVCSAAGHAVLAAAAAIEAGDTENALVVGWGAASKLAETDSRVNQFDPFYMRPVGATPAVLAALQKQTLVASELVSRQEIEAFQDRMAGILWPPEKAGADSLTRGFCDGVAALVLKRVPDGSPGVTVGDYSTASRSHCPLDGSMDPADWVREAISGFSSSGSKGAPRRGFIEASGSTSLAELRAIAASIDSGLVDCEAATANRRGGGATAWFGPATGLRALAALCRDLLTEDAGDEPDAGLFVDLAGPLGQHVTSIFVERRSAA